MNSFNVLGNFKHILEKYETSVDLSKSPYLAHPKLEGRHVIHLINYTDYSVEVAYAQFKAYLPKNQYPRGIVLGKHVTVTKKDGSKKTKLTVYIQWKKDYSILTLKICSNGESEVQRKKVEMVQRHPLQFFPKDRISIPQNRIHTLEIYHRESLFGNEYRCQYRSGDFIFMACYHHKKWNGWEALDTKTEKIASSNCLWGGSDEDWKKFTEQSDWKLMEEEVSPYCLTSMGIDVVEPANQITVSLSEKQTLTVYVVTGDKSRYLAIRREKDQKEKKPVVYLNEFGQWMRMQVLTDAWSATFGEYILEDGSPLSVSNRQKFRGKELMPIEQTSWQDLGIQVLQK